jgi:hypothetical protein
MSMSMLQVPGELISVVSFSITLFTIMQSSSKQIGENVMKIDPLSSELHITEFSCNMILCII